MQQSVRYSADNYTSIIPDSFTYLLCSKLCWHNRLIPICDVEASLIPIIQWKFCIGTTEQLMHACTTRKTEEGSTIFGPAMRSSQSLGYLWLGLWWGDWVSRKRYRFVMGVKCWIFRATNLYWQQCNDAFSNNKLYLIILQNKFWVQRQPGTVVTTHSLS